MIDWILNLQNIFLAAAAAGGFVLVVQVALALLFGGDADADGAHDALHDAGDAGHGVSFRTVVAFITFFGIGGMAAKGFDASTPWSLAIALLSGAAAFWLVGLAMLQLSRLRSSGTLDIHNAVGQQARVYLAIPGQEGGEGRVTVAVQGRTIQARAVTRGASLPTGGFCQVIAVRGADTLEVAAIPSVQGLAGKRP